LNKERLKTLQGSISLDSMVVAAPDQVSSDLDGEAVILNLQSGVYYGLNVVGARVWSLMQQATSVRAIRDVLLAAYDVDWARCESDLLALLQQMASLGLVEVLDE